MTGQGSCSFALEPVYIDGDQMAVRGWFFQEGHMQIELEDAPGHPIPGFSKHDCISITGVDHYHPVEWRNSGNLRELTGRLVRIRFHFQDAKLHAFLIS